MPDSPLSSSPAPLSISSWTTKVEDNAIQPSPQVEETLPEPLPHTPQDSSSATQVNLQQTPAQHVTHIPDDSFSGAPIKVDQRSAEQTTTTNFRQRQRHPRKAKRESAGQNPSKILPQPAAKKTGRGRQAAENGPTLAADTEADTHNQARGTKRSRAGDAAVSSDGAQITQKRRKTTKPATKSKR